MKYRHKKVLKAAKGYYGARSRTFRSAQPAVIRAACNAYRGRKQKKRHFRRLWIVRINAAVRQYGLNYSQFMHGLLQSNIKLNRAILAEWAVLHSERFESIVQQAKEALVTTAPAVKAA